MKYIHIACPSPVTATDDTVAARALEANDSSYAGEEQGNGEFVGEKSANADAGSGDPEQLTKASGEARSRSLPPPVGGSEEKRGGYCGGGCVVM